jgi:hypothetical protein
MTILVCIEPEAPVCAWLNEEEDVVLIFPPEATAREVQAALDPIYPCKVTNAWAQIPGQRRPGPPPPSHTNRPRGQGHREGW